MNFWVYLNRFYSKYKQLIWFIIAVIILFLLVMKSYDKALKKAGDSGGNNKATAISKNVSNENLSNTIKTISSNYNSNTNQKDKESAKQKSMEELQKNIKSKTDTIETFILLCNNKQPELAYELLSQDCKSEIYPTLQEFCTNYYDGIFKTNKIYKIEKFKNNTYKIAYSNNSLETGIQDSTQIIDYITVIEQNNEYALNISKLINVESSNLYAQNSYFNISVINKIVYMDYEEYTLKVKNIIKADIYLNKDDGSSLYLLNSKNQKFEIITQEYVDADYFVQSESEKIIKLKFNKKFGDSEEYKSMNFENIRIVNKEYYNEPTNNNSQGTTYYEKMTTNYPTRTVFSIKM